MAALSIFIPALAVAACAFAGDRAVFPGDDWRRASPASQGLDPAKLREAVAYMESSFGPEGARELVVIRNGHLVYEGPGTDNYHNVWSCTKTFTSTVLGLLAGDGKCSLDDLAVKYLPELGAAYPEYATIQLRHLASMTSGYQGEVVNVTKEQPWGDPMYFLKPLKPLFEPGTQVQYHDHQVQLLGKILTRIAGEPLKSVFARRIAAPIGWTRWDWGVIGEDNGIALNNAPGNPAKPGIQTTPRQMARYGYLYLNRGQWRGKQLLAESFVKEAGSNQAPGAGKSAFLHQRYGFYWWTNGVMPGGQRPWPDGPPGAYTAHGHGSNFCFVLPEWNMVVVRMGTRPIAGSVRQEDDLWNVFLARVGAALHARGR